ncbi:MAG: sugar phosphate isomerase/epimerase family protein, partial [Geminicoccaceae bacterium]
LTGKPSTRQLIERAATAEGLSAVDLNYPDQVTAEGAPAMRRLLEDHGLALNGMAMRYYGDPAFKAGAFTHPDPAIRQKAIDLTKAGIDAVREADADLMTVWLGQDGFDHPFGADYARLWALEVDGLREIAEHDPQCRISIEYKPDEPRAYSLLGDVGTTLLAIDEAGAANLGVTLDFAHVLYAGENPAMSAALVARRSKLMGLHLNDGYGRRDDGLMVGSVHGQQTIELLLQARRDGYDGAIYFDTFPDVSGLDPVAECEANIETVRAMLTVVERLESDNRLGEALSAQDAVTGQRIVQKAMMG